MKNRILGLISELNPRRSGLLGVPRQFDTWTFSLHNNRELILEMMTPKHFVLPAVTIPKEGASQLFVVPLAMHSTESILQVTRAEPMYKLSRNLAVLAAFNTTQIPDIEG